MNTWDKRHTLLLITILVNFFVLLASPALYQPPRLADQRDKVLVNLIVCFAPLFWTIFLTVWGHSRFALVLGLINILPAMCWLFSAFQLVAIAFYS